MNVNNTNNTNNAGHATGAPPTPSAAPVGAPPATAATNFETAGLPTPRVTGQLGLLSDDSMREVLRLVAPRDRLSMANALRRGDRSDPAGLQSLNTVLAQSLPSARRAVAAAAAEVPADIEEIARASVEAAVNDPNIDELQRRDEVIEALATRVRELPLRERIGACEALGRGLLQDEEGYRLVMMEFRAVLRAQLRGAVMDPDFARLGFNMTEFVTFLEARDQGFINQLQMRAVAQSTGRESVWAAANRGSSVAEIATKFGITHAPAIRTIQLAVVNSDHPNSAKAAVNTGEPVAQVAARFNINIHSMIFRLEKLQINSESPGSAGLAARTGSHNVQTLLTTYGITTFAGRLALQLAAAQSTLPGSAGLLVLQGRKVNEIADQFGIRDNRALIELEKHQIESDDPESAGFAVRAGGNVAEQADVHGISTAKGLAALQSKSFIHFALPAVSDGQDAQTIIERCGIVREDFINRLHETASAYLLGH